MFHIKKNNQEVITPIKEHKTVTWHCFITPFNSTESGEVAS